MKTLILSKWLLAASMGAAVISCAPPPRHITHTPVAAGPAFGTAPMSPQESLYDWYDDGGPGEVTIRIKLSTQMASFTRGDRDIGWSYVATGKSSHRTPSGSFRITEKVVDKYSNAYGSMVDAYGNVTNPDASSRDRVPAGQRYVPAPMPYWMRLTSWGIGMHAGPIPNPGSPASHGCIRFPRQLAPKLYHAVRVGTRVTIVQ